MKTIKVEKVIKEGLVFSIIDDVDESTHSCLLYPMQCLELIGEIRNNLFKWSEITGKPIDVK